MVPGRLDGELPQLEKKETAGSRAVTVISTFKVTYSEKMFWFEAAQNPLSVVNGKAWGRGGEPGCLLLPSECSVAEPAGTVPRHPWGTRMTQCFKSQLQTLFQLLVNSHFEKQQVQVLGIWSPIIL